ncbi:hypothetical protein PoB_000823500 [Plakobranchus ocellatus]|uniref:Uncharacterized protein n=1 Tax=Plakobranchus ocellatus TaxID=259542 RepID=A0AAV3YGU3_9GAST|nr:hypothetical protein PoB_000823500 [Plakobranchus ocellatus]
MHCEVITLGNILQTVCKKPLVHYVGFGKAADFTAIKNHSVLHTSMSLLDGSHCHRIRTPRSLVDIKPSSVKLFSTSKTDIHYAKYDFASPAFFPLQSELLTTFIFKTPPQIANLLWL